MRSNTSLIWRLDTLSMRLSFQNHFSVQAVCQQCRVFVVCSCRYDTARPTQLGPHECNVILTRHQQEEGGYHVPKAPEQVIRCDAGCDTSPDQNQRQWDH